MRDWFAQQAPQEEGTAGAVATGLMRCKGVHEPQSSKLKGNYAYYFLWLQFHLHKLLQIN